VGGSVELLEAGGAALIAGDWRSALYVTLERTGEVVAVRGGKVAWRAPVGASPHGIVADNQRNTILAAGPAPTGSPSSTPEPVPSSTQSWWPLGQRA